MSYGTYFWINGGHESREEIKDDENKKEAGEEEEEEEKGKKWSMGDGIVSGRYAKNLKLSLDVEARKRGSDGDGATGNRKRPGIQSKNPFSF